MLYDLIPIAIILLCFLGILYLVVRKFPAVASLDVDTMPQEKEKRVKHQLLSSRLKRNLKRYGATVNRATRPATTWVRERTQGSYQRLLELREQYRQAPAAGKRPRASEIDQLFNAAERSRHEEHFAEAERCYIKILSLDSKSIEAFKQLGSLYLEMGKLDEAKATLEHVLKLTQEDAAVYEQLATIDKENGSFDSSKKNYQQALKLNSQNGNTYFNLAELNQQQEQYGEAVSNLKEALNIEPKNPRYLDALCSVCILSKNKTEAESAYNTLKEINPENAKLAEMKKQIEDL